MANPKTIEQTIVMPGGAGVPGLLLFLVSLSLVFAAPAMLFTNELPLFFKPLLILVALTSAVIAKSAAEGVFPRSVKVSSEGLTFYHMGSSQSFSWADVEQIKLMTGAGGLDENPIYSEEKRRLIGLYLKSKPEPRAKRGRGQQPAKKPADDPPKSDTGPDLILASGDVRHEQAIAAAYRTITGARKRTPRKFGAKLSKRTSNGKADFRKQVA